MKLSRRQLTLAMVGIGVLLIVLWVAHRHHRHSVMVTWNPSPRAVEYNVFRRTTSTEYEPIATHVPKPQYEDYAVQSGVVYYYAVQAVDYQDRTSRLSEPIEAKVP